MTKRKFSFRSATGRTVTIETGMDEAAARGAAMSHFWGPPDRRVTFENRGLGLDLIAVDGEPLAAREGPVVAT